MTMSTRDIVTINSKLHPFGQRQIALLAQLIALDPNTKAKTLYLCCLFDRVELDWTPWTKMDSIKLEDDIQNAFW